jgi:flagellar biosynthetic protein FliP
VRLALLITILSLAPFILVMVSSFTRVVVVLVFLRSALGLQQIPPHAVLIPLALLVTGFIMAPTLEQARPEHPTNPRVAPAGDRKRKPAGDK